MELYEHMNSNGIPSSDPSLLACLSEDRIKRFHVDGDKRGSRNGWAVLHTTPQGKQLVNYGTWKGASPSDGFTWVESGGELTTEDHKFLQAKRKRVEARMEALRPRRKKAVKQLLSTLSPEPGDHPYLKSKGVGLPPNHGLLRGREHLVVPVYQDEEVESYQKIKRGFKGYASGRGALKVSGGYHILNAPKVPGGDIVVAEGLATALSVGEMLEWKTPVAVAFSAHALSEVVGKMKAQGYSRVLVAGDNDLPDSRGHRAGQEAAMQAKEKHGAVPVIAPEEGKDWNDYHQAYGLEEARKSWAGILEKATKEKTSLLHEVKSKAFQGDIRRSLSRHDLWHGTFESAKWVVEGLIPQAGLTVLASPPKRGKSWLALQLAIAVESGAPFLGMNTTKGKVVYYALEDTERRLVERVHGLHPQGRPVGLPHCELTIPRLDQGGLEALVSMIEEEKPSLIILDTWSKIKGSPERGLNAYEADYRLVAPLKALADVAGVAILLVTHLNKHHRGLDDIESITGSMGLPGAADALLFLKRDEHEGSAKLARDGRDFSDTEPLVLKWDSPGWRIAEQHEQRDVVMESLTEFQTVILGVLEEYAGFEGMTPKEVSDYLTQGEADEEKKQKHRAKVKLDMPRMEKKGVLLKMSRGKYLPSVVEREENLDTDDTFDTDDTGDTFDTFAPERPRYQAVSRCI